MTLCGAGVDVTHRLVPKAGMGGQVPGGSNARAGSRPHRHSVAGQSPWSTHNGRGHGTVTHSVDKGKYLLALRGGTRSSTISPWLQHHWKLLHRTATFHGRSWAFTCFNRLCYAPYLMLARSTDIQHQAPSAPQHAPLPPEPLPHTCMLLLPHNHTQTCRQQQPVSELPTSTHVMLSHA